MKPLYIFALMWAIFITGLSDGISMALTPIPGIGIVLAFAITFCINVTMGAGLLFLLATQGMYHPKFGPFTLIGGLLPGLNFLPFWLGLVIAGIVHDKSKEGGSLGALAKLADDLQSTKNPLARAKSVLSASKNMRGSVGRPVQDSNDSQSQNQQEERPRNLPNLKSPSLAPRMSSDIAPRNPSYAKAA